LGRREREKGGMGYSENISAHTAITTTIIIILGKREEKQGDKKETNFWTQRRNYKKIYPTCAKIWFLLLT